MLALGHRHPAVAGRQALVGGVDHGELAAAGLEQFQADAGGGEVDAAALELALGQAVEIDRAEVDVWADRRKIGVKDRIDHHLAAGVFKGIEVVEDKAFWGLDQAGFLAGEGATGPRHQPELALLTGLGTKALGRPLLAEHEAEGIEGHGVLQEHRPVGGDGEIVQKGEALEAVGVVGQKLAGLVAAGGELHQPHLAGGAGLDTEAHQPGFAVVAGIESRVGTEGLVGLEHAIEQGDAFGFEGVGIEGMGGAGFPEGQELVAQPHHLGVGDVFEAKVEGVGDRAAGLLGAEDAAIQDLVRLLFGQPTLRAHEAIAELERSGVKAQGGNHAVAIKGMVHPMAAALEPARAIAIEGARQLAGDRAAASEQGHGRELHAHIAEGTRPISPVVGRPNWRRIGANGGTALGTGGSAGGSGHGKARDIDPSSRNGV